MSFILRVAVLGFGAEIWGFGELLSGKRAHTIPPGTGNNFKGSITMATVSKPAGLSETSSLQNLGDKYKQRLAERSHQDKSVNTSDGLCV